MLALEQIILICLLLRPALTVSAQAPSELKNKYGPPMEVYKVRPDVLLTVTRGADNQACELVIERRHTTEYGFDSRSEIPPALAEEIINEIVPLAKRGKVHAEQTINFTNTCSFVVVQDYENVLIQRTEEGCGAAGTRPVVSVRLKWRTFQGSGVK